jgi:DNA-directed RNA polymerase subunit RPC12/RpoP
MGFAFIDLRCKRCNARFGFKGDLSKTRTVSCPKCGFKISKKTIESIQAELTQARKQLQKQPRPIRAHKFKRLHQPFHEVNQKLIRDMNKRFQHLKDYVISQLGGVNEIANASNAWDLLINLFYIKQKHSHGQVCAVLADAMNVPYPRMLELYREIKARKTPRKEPK